jgi:hypothetical protein
VWHFIYRSTEGVWIENTYTIGTTGTSAPIACIVQNYATGYVYFTAMIDGEPQKRCRALLQITGGEIVLMDGNATFDCNFWGEYPITSHGVDAYQSAMVAAHNALLDNSGASGGNIDNGTFWSVVPVRAIVQGPTGQRIFRTSGGRMQRTSQAGVWFDLAGRVWVAYCVNDNGIDGALIAACENGAVEHIADGTGLYVDAGGVRLDAQAIATQTRAEVIQNEGGKLVIWEKLL